MTDLEQIAALAAQGVGRRNAEATVGHVFTPSELAAFRRAQTIRQLRIAQKKARGPMSVAERVRRHVAAANEVPAFDPRPRHPRLKERCRNDLALFGWMYCREVLLHAPSPALRDGLIRSAQEIILSGGQAVKLYGRGTGKTTWVVYIAAVWAILYGHRRYIVLVSANGKQAKKNLKTIKRILARSPGIRADFPAVAVALRELGEVAQRAASQTWHGEPTDVEWSSEQIKLPMLRDADGRPMDAGCGAIVGSVGIGGAIRGANEGGQRPDFLLLDDPQTRKIAHSPSLVADVIGYIHNDALQLAGHDRRISAFVTITPQCYGDVSTELTSQTKHPEWDVTCEPFVTATPPGWDDLLDEYDHVYAEDAHNHDHAFSRSRAWYLANRERFAGTVVIDPEQYDHKLEIDAIHHLLNQHATLGAQAFDAEIMMRAADRATELAITPDLVANAVNGTPRRVLPPGTDCAVAFCDINIRRGSGLSWVVVAFGPGRVAAVVDYGRYPSTGALVPPNASTLERDNRVAEGIRTIVAGMRDMCDAGKPGHLRDARGRPVAIRALAFDRGYLPDVVHRTLYVLTHSLSLPFVVCETRGFGWNRFGVRKGDMLRLGDHIFATRSPTGADYLAQMSPYWKEIMQASFLETPLMPGSLSLFGKTPTGPGHDHYVLAQEICNEKLVRKYTVERAGRTETAWDWATSGENHFGDALTGAFAVGSWYRCYDNLSAVLDPVIRRPLPKTAQMDLFDPRDNGAITGYLSVDEAAAAAAEPAPVPARLAPRRRRRGGYRLA